MQCHTFTLTTLNSLQSSGRLLQTLMQNLSIRVHAKRMEPSIKFHKLLHWPESICYFGSPTNYDSQTFESAHKLFVKPMCGRINQSGLGAEASALNKDFIASIHRTTQDSSSDDNENPDGPKLRCLTKQQIRSSVQLSQFRSLEFGSTCGLRRFYTTENI